MDELISSLAFKLTKSMNILTSLLEPTSPLILQTLLDSF